MPTVESNVLDLDDVDEVTEALAQFNDAYLAAGGTEPRPRRPPPVGDVTREQDILESETNVQADYATWLVLHGLLLVGLKHPTVPPFAGRVGYTFAAHLGQELVDAGVCHPGFMQQELDKLPVPAGLKPAIINRVPVPEGRCPRCGREECEPHQDGNVRRCARTGAAL